MELIFLGIVIWIFGSVLFAEVLKVLFEIGGCLIQFLFLCVWYTAKGIYWLLGWIWDQFTRGVSRLLSEAGLFFGILIDEWRRGSPEDHENEQAYAAGANGDDVNPQSAYERALALLGFSEPFTKDDLKRVYREAMKAAHTDHGGRKEDAQALNAARDLIMKTKGWA